MGSLRSSYSSCFLPDVAPVDHSLLFAFAQPPHDGVRRARCVNRSRDLRGITALRFRTLNEITSPIVPRERRRLRLSRREVQFLSSRRQILLAPAELGVVDPHAVQDDRQLRATATRARAMPRRFATCMPQARSADHFVLRISSEWAAS